MKAKLEPLLIGRREAAELLAISERHLANQTKLGNVPCHRLGRSVRYCVEELKAMIRREGGVC